MDKYHVLELIGEGQFGKVYKGRRKFGSQMVALKFIGKKGKSDKELNALRQEMLILSSLTDCAYIIRMLDWFETASEVCVVTEFAQGELFEILEDDTSLPESTVRQIAIQLVAGLRYLHAHRIIHRDMKPQNILIGNGGVLKIADFGFARTMSENTSLLTSVKGTPLYMAPELVRSMPYGHQCDLWSVGVICYELFVGQPPFFTNSFYTLVHLIVDTPVNYPASMSPEFKSFLEGLLHKTPSKRLSWPELQNHPFVRETEEEQRARNEIAMQGANTGMQIPSAPPATAGPATSAGRHGTPRVQGQPTGLGGAALPPSSAASKPNTAASALPPIHAQPASAAATAKPANQSARATTAASAASSAASKGATGASTPDGGTRSRSGSTELDLRQLPQLLSPASAAMLPNTLQELTAMLQRASASSQLPSPLLDIYPTLLSEHVPAQLCRLLVSTASGSHAPALDLAATMSCVLPALVAMLHPSGGPVAPMPLYTAEAATGDGSSPNGAGAATASNRASVRAAVGRAPPNLELQLRRQMAESVCLPPEGLQSSRTSAFDLFSQATRAACKSDSAALSGRGDPSPLLSNLVIVLFQCTRSCVAPSAAAAAAASSGAASSAPSTPAPSTSLLDALSKDVGLLSALLSTLALCAVNLSSGEVSPRSRLAGRLLLFFASLCGKTPAVVKTLVQGCGLDCTNVLGMLSSPASIVALPASFLLSQLLTNPYAKLESAVSNPLPLLESIARLLQLPAMSPSHPATLLVELEGSGVGYSIFGSHDGLLQLLQALLYFHALQAAKQPQKALIGAEALKQSERFLTNNIWPMIMGRLEKLEAPAAATADVHAAAELSVLGWMSLLSIVLELLKMNAQSSAAGVSGSLLSDALFRGMCALLSPSRVAALYAWPEACGGGSVGVGLLLKRALSILYVPFTASSASSRALTPAQVAAQEHQLARAQKVLFNCGFVRRLLSASRLLELPAQLEAPLGFLVHLTIRNANFEKQMLDSGGLQLLAHKQLLNPAPRATMVPSAAGGGGSSGGGGVVKVTVTPSAVLLTDALMIVSHVARSSAANYPAIHAANLLADLKSLLGHNDAGVRAKTANVLGNLCRHSAFFYPHLRAAGILPGLVACTSDGDANVRKWAAFALGNAVFYDASLCAEVVAAIPALLRLLSAKDDPASGGADRTAQNAAGVLTNMLRHGVAAQEMIDQGAVETLVQLLAEANTDGEAATGKQPSAMQVQCARSALFTLGDLAAFRSARQRLQQHGLLDRIQAVQRSSQDPKLQTYYQRFVTRSQGPLQG